MEFEDRRYVIIPTTEVSNVDFNEVLETSEETCRYSVDGTQTFVKYDGSMPSSIALISNKSQEYSYAEILDILSTPVWTELLE